MKSCSRKTSLWKRRPAAEIDIAVMPDAWHPAYIEIASDDEGFDIEPPCVVFGAFSKQAHPTSFIADNDRILLPPEVAHQTRSVHILDGLGRHDRRRPDELANPRSRRRSQGRHGRAVSRGGVTSDWPKADKAAQIQLLR
jgi:hypothetical protein